MKKFAILLIGFLIFIPVSVLADCNKQGATVVFINGIFNDKISAKNSKDRLESLYKNFGAEKDVKFLTGYNESHVGGADDILRGITQAYLGGYVDYNLTNILNEVKKELETNKVLLIGHSQGSFYANAAYDYLIQEGGVARERIAVYNIATPADRVAGGGKYLNSSSDQLIKDIISNLAKIGFARVPLQPNIDIKMTEQELKDSDGGHSFSKAYLAKASDRIIADIDSALGKLEYKESKMADGSCFKSPEIGTVYIVQDRGYRFVNTFAEATKDKRVFMTGVPPETLRGLSQAIGNGFTFLGQMAEESLKRYKLGISSQGGASLSDAFGNQNPPLDDSSNLPDIPRVQLATNFLGTGSSLPDDPQDQLDDIQEKLDVLSGIIKNLLPKPAIVERLPDPLFSPDNNQVTQSNTSDNNYSGSSGGSTNSYQKILISEVQTGSKADEKQEFIELYNPNDKSIELTNWYLQRKTAGSSSWLTYVASSEFLGKLIPAKGFFLIAREGYFAGTADVYTDNPITNDNSFVLKNPNGEVSDKLGFGTAMDPEGSSTQNPSTSLDQTIGRKVLASGLEQDYDSNSTDFELQLSTPKATNVTYPSAPEPIKKILINEVQVGGVTAKDEFIELYNPNTTDVSLTGFSLKKKTSSGAESNLVSSGSFTGTIKAGGYFLIAPQDNSDGTKNYTYSAVPNLRYSGKDYSIAKDNTILIYNKDDVLLDKVGLGSATDFENTATLNPDDSKAVERKGIGVDTDNNFSDFRVTDNPTPGASFMQANIIDATNYENNLGSGNGNYNYDLSIGWSSKTPNLDYFQVQYKINSGEWVDWLANTTLTSKNISAYYSLLNDSNIYYFRVRSYDKDKNVSEWSQLNVDLSSPVFINEVAIYGTTADKTDQWIELYNKTADEIDLTGWKIISGSTTINLSGKISPKGYFVLEKKDSNALSYAENQIFTGSLDVGSIKLYNDKKRFIDQFYNSSWWSEASCTKGSDRYSLERISIYSYGGERYNWKINDGITKNDADRLSNAINGTPGAQNSSYQLYTYVTYGFPINTQISKNLNPYIFSTDTTVASGATLTVNPGVIVKFRETASTLLVRGTLKVLGQSADKVIFTSYKDDEYGGDTNNDGASTSGDFGQWTGINFSGTSVNSELQNILIRFAGAFSGGISNAILADASNVTIKDSTLEKSGNIGINLINSNSIIDNVKFLETNGDKKAIYVQAGSPEIKNSYFYKNDYGIYISRWYDSSSVVYKATPIISNNDFQNNKEPVFMGELCYPVFSNNQATNNTYNTITFSDDIKENMTLSPDLPYLIKNMNTINAGVTLTIKPGTILSFLSNTSSLLINGTLNAVGTDSSKIIFRPYYYDSPSIVPGSWRGLIFSKTSAGSQLENVNISYAGACNGDCSSSTYKGAIKVDQSVISLKNSVFENNANSGVWLINSPSLIDGVSFSKHETQPFGITAGAVRIEGGSPEVKKSTFQGNSSNFLKSSWTNPDTLEVVPATPNLHDVDPADPDKNIIL